MFNLKLNQDLENMPDLSDLNNPEKLTPARKQRWAELKRKYTREGNKMFFYGPIPLREILEIIDIEFSGKQGVGDDCLIFTQSEIEARTKRPRNGQKKQEK